MPLYGNNIEFSVEIHLLNDMMNRRLQSCAFPEQEIKNSLSEQANKSRMKSHKATEHKPLRKHDTQKK